ncbi:MAG: pantoate--beta-alanine ligase [Fimbriimonadales bacterium]|nr:pantoate--beta-alanine ligase [Fimbriimonadales bacterium]
MFRVPQEWRKPEGARVGFVPTMGALHEGHLSLMRQARRECAVVVASIFVNPTQFGPNEDYERYPRDEAEDLRLCESVGVDAVFAPDVRTMYPRRTTVVAVRGVTERWEGAFRPGHFDGVTTVVAKLFHIVQPDAAYFGLKDLQQCAVIRRMVEDLNFPVELRFCATVREPDGLAMSSRNRYLTSEERRRASSLYRALCECRSEAAEGRSLAITLDRVRMRLEQEGFAVDYVAWIDPQTMDPVDRLKEDSRLIAAVRLGGVRLIDNIGLHED